MFLWYSWSFRIWLLLLYNVLHLVCWNIRVFMVVSKVDRLFLEFYAMRDCSRLLRSVFVPGGDLERSLLILFCLYYSYNNTDERLKTAPSGRQGPQDHQSWIQVHEGSLRQINNLGLMMPILSKF